MDQERKEGLKEEWFELRWVEEEERAAGGRVDWGRLWNLTVGGKRVRAKMRGHAGQAGGKEEWKSPSTEQPHCFVVVGRISFINHACHEHSNITRASCQTGSRVRGRWWGRSSGRRRQ
jgi:hypothetical protein